MQNVGPDLISRSLTFIYGYSNSKEEKDSLPSLQYNMKPSGLLGVFILRVKKGSDKSDSPLSLVFSS